MLQLIYMIRKLSFQNKKIIIQREKGKNATGKNMDPAKPSFLTVHPDLQHILNFYRQNPQHFLQVRKWSISFFFAVMWTWINMRIWSQYKRWSQAHIFIIFYVLPTRIWCLNSKSPGASSHSSSLWSKTDINKPLQAFNLQLLTVQFIGLFLQTFQTVVKFVCARFLDLVSQTFQASRIRVRL